MGAAGPAVLVCSGTGKGEKLPQFTGIFETSCFRPAFSFMYDAMPELAEVETVRKHLDQVMRGQKIKEVVLDEQDRFVFAFTKPALLRKALTGAKVTGSGRKGKYFWLELDRRPWPVFHMGMTGKISILRPPGAHAPKAATPALWEGIQLRSPVKGAEPEPERLWFSRLIMKLQNGAEVAFIDPRRFGRIWLADDPLAHPRLKKLGPDPLGEFPAAKELYEKLKKRKVAIKALLLDQKVFAGIGNYLADEILFQARLSPHRKASELSSTDVARLRRVMMAVLKKAVSLDADYERFPKSWLFHHRWGKSKTAKTSAGHRIIHEEIGGRTSAWVPTLQK